jgi:hypothetical protein
MLSKMKINHVSSAGGSNSTGEREGGKEKGTERERERERMNERQREHPKFI